MRSRHLLPISLLLASCTTGQGEGSVTSDGLYIENCWDGAFDLHPSFFGTTPFDNTQQIRIQRGDRLIEVSDGVELLVSDVSTIRANPGQAVSLGLPVGVRPPGAPIIVQQNPPLVSLTLYLYNTCHVQNGAAYSISGSVTFASLFSGDRNETNADARLTDATFEAVVANPHDARIGIDPITNEATVTYPAEKTSTLKGNFRFFFQRGVPAQPFP